MIAKMKKYIELSESDFNELRALAGVKRKDSLLGFEFESNQSDFAQALREKIRMQKKNKVNKNGFREVRGEALLLPAEDFDSNFESAQ